VLATRVKVMATSDKKKKKKQQLESASGTAPDGAKASDLVAIPSQNLLSIEEGAADRPGDQPAGAEESDGTPAQLGATKYVHAAFFAAAILAAFLASKLLATGWNRLAEWPAAVRLMPVLLHYGESERATFGMVGGVLVGGLTLWEIYRRRHVREWADEVAIELSRVTWPTREQVTNGTIVVLVASAVATVYVSLLDRLWGFVTTLVYGA
jgi:preprotein translocase subunit SecE